MRTNRSRSSPAERIAWILVAAAGALGIATAAVGSAPEPASAPADPVAARGEYLVVIGGCNDCHTPLVMGPQGPESDMSRMLSGHPQDAPLEPLPEVDPTATWNWSGHAQVTAFAGPWGISVAPQRIAVLAR
jgi:mono/diheme cytochrome c family protein